MTVTGPTGKPTVRQDEADAHHLEVPLTEEIVHHRHEELVHRHTRIAIQQGPEAVSETINGHEAVLRDEGREVR